MMAGIAAIAVACGKTVASTDGGVAHMDSGMPSRAGGQRSTGGAFVSGGGASSGGVRSAGGVPSMGGVAPSGGTSASGGSPAAGGARSGGGMSASGGASSVGVPDASLPLGGFPDLAPRCASGALTCPTMSGFNALTACCTATNDCGFDPAPLMNFRDVPQGCQALAEPGMASTTCVPADGSSCCRFDGTCGTELSLWGLGCVSTASDAGSRVPCFLTGSCRMVAEVTTTTKKGLYGPANVGAIWVETSGGKFVKTLTRWGFITITNVVAWERASMGNTVDAVSGATRRIHGPIQATWNCTDAERNPVPHGSYLLCMSFIEQNVQPFFDAGSAYAPYCVPFEFAANPVDITAPSGGGFSDIRIVVR